MSAPRPYYGANMSVTPDELAAVRAYRAAHARFLAAVKADDSDDLLIDNLSADVDKLRRPARDAEQRIALRLHPVGKRFAMLVVWACDTLCTLTRHAGGCWVLNRSPLHKLWRWAVCFADDAVARCITAYLNADGVATMTATATGSTVTTTMWVWPTDGGAA